MKRFVVILLACLLLCGCQAQAPTATQAPETTAPEAVTVTQAASPTTEPDLSGLELPPVSGLTPGYYLISSVGKDGDITFYGTPDPENGFLLLNADGTGTFSFEGVEGALTWEEDAVHWQGQTLMAAAMHYYDDALGRDETIVALYFLDPVVSVCLRPATVPEEAP